MNLLTPSSVPLRFNFVSLLVVRLRKDQLKVPVVARTLFNKRLLLSVCKNLRLIARMSSLYSPCVHLVIFNFC